MSSDEAITYEANEIEKSKLKQDMENIEKALGYGLDFDAKEYSTIMKRSLFSYSLDYVKDAVLAVPATGEEIYFEIYGADDHHGMFLLVEREL